ncbi:FAD-binding oxidoreductase [Paenibacillus sp. TRM 82003]|uniref:FAD-binding oxidoreductase n=1 Tax=Kineococcus sp. TRM81007 TaxID=2925831 RepID=UPI001F57CEF6|nr:FAD-binding oxidoreductase [Kineococcus sp. TRM81007]MCI3925251.1 FAD-binding oxidoreductase [Paenibacillus sp. TRM 82003]
MDRPAASAEDPSRAPARLTGWGRTAPTTATVLRTADLDVLAEAVRTAGPRGVIARGLGRSYGDPAQNAGGLVIDMTALDRIHDIDVDTAVADVDAGCSLDKLLRAVVPHGLWVPVLPGTRQVTVGGAIGADIHGGNHHTQGTFTRHVLSLDLLTADGEVRTLTPDGPDRELFLATTGGMGLTGIVLRARIRLDRVETSYFIADVEQAPDFDEMLERLTRNDENYTYSKTWFDSVTKGAHMGRGFLLRGSSAKLEDLPAKLRKDPLKFDAPQLATFPDVFPPGMLNRLTAKALNEFYYRKAHTQQGVVQNITQFYHLLDLFADWNRAYGPRGFLQYQFVVPMDRTDVLRASMEAIVESGHISALNVLKRFGEGNDAPLSFPRKGWTLAVDLPVKPGLDALCDRLDEMVLDAGGRLYLAKDSRTTADRFAQMYPELPAWRKVRDAVDPERKFASDQSRRLQLVTG